MVHQINNLKMITPKEQEEKEVSELNSEITEQNKHSMVVKMIRVDSFKES